MSGPARQSYYEIALTNRQVLTVFVVLLVAVLAAFLSGVWVGRRGAVPRAEMVEAQAIEAAAEPGEEPLARLDFFSRDGAAAPAGDAGVAEAVVEPASPPPVETEPPLEEAPMPEPVPVEPAPRTEPAPAKRPASPAPNRQAEVSEPSAPAPAAGSLVIQVFSSNNQVQAQGIVDRLRSGGLPALLSPVEVSGRTMYRVRIGPYADRQVAEGVAEQVRRDYRLETWITE